MAGDELVDYGLVRRRLLRRSAHVLVLVLSRHPDLAVLTWTVTPDVLRGHADVCDLDPGRDRRVDRSSPRQHGQSQAGSGPPSRQNLIIHTVLKRSVALWVKDAMGR